MALHPRKLHPLPLRVMHWTNAIAIFIMVGSGWKIYNDEVIFGWLHFPECLTIGKWAQHGLQWHFLGMWIFALNGIAYLTYGLVTGRFRGMLLPVRWSELMQTVKDALHFHLAHEDLTKYNTVQKLLYIGVISVGIMMVVSGLAIWKPVQFLRIAVAVRHLPERTARAFPRHVGDRAVCRRACWVGPAGASHAAVDGHRRA